MVILSLARNCIVGTVAHQIECIGLAFGGILPVTQLILNELFIPAIPSCVYSGASDQLEHTISQSR